MQSKTTKLEGEKCSCVGSCGSTCVNRLLWIECYGGNPDKPKQLTNCNVGPKCTNRLLQTDKPVDVEPFRVCVLVVGQMAGVCACLLKCRSRVPFCDALMVRLAPVWCCERHGPPVP